MDSLARVRREALSALMPPPAVTLAEWIESNVRLPQGVSAQPGAVRLWPYQREIADAIGDKRIERVTLVKSARLGFTTLLSGAIGHFCANEPSPILALLPTEADARDYVVSDIEPIFEASPALRGLLEADASEGGRNTLLSRRFPGGSLKIVAAKSPRNLRRHNARVVLVDEADAMDPSAEGSPIALAEKRTLAFPDRKIVIGSTPLHAETSNVIRSYAASDKRVFEVPCPSCGAFIFLKWAHIEWQEKRPETAAFRCPHCMELIEERHKMAMIRAGRWDAQAPEVRGHAGFWINALVSPLPNASWGKLAEEFLRAKDDPDLLQPFVNTVLGEGWSDAEEQADELALQQRLEPFGLDRIPPEVLAVTIGVDVQDDRLEATIVGWSRVEALILGHAVIWGSPDDDSTWSELDELSRTRWRHPFGGQLRVDAMIVDSGDGDWTDKVYAFCFPRLSRRIMAGKGVFGSRPALQASKSKVKGGRLFLIGVDGLKTTIYSRLARGRSIRFSDSLEPVFFEQLCSERKILRYVRGLPQRRFERIPGRAAEALDCTVYAFAARQGVTILFDQREAELRSAEPPKAPPRVMRSSWMDR
ncbi:phage terminase large subunit family protein [Methylocystis sp. WRRC1]|uniref:phage terminase large subunit family protein n=1 Tax=Methylocystis sp. WRRC1 TaxID=1732014 RepID=UPI001D14E8D0|nr:phage terminase large subunit family protein [Methylocystis sp. WRRC1]MCC3245094.1 phage terminase large subunit family protein [Methylocystis sp. WRRC1]